MILVCLVYFWTSTLLMVTLVLEICSFWYIDSRIRVQNSISIFSEFQNRLRQRFRRVLKFFHWPSVCFLVNKCLRSCDVRTFRGEWKDINLECRSSTETWLHLFCLCSYSTVTFENVDALARKAAISLHILLVCVL